jgi:Glycosyl hydrolase catalytic core
VAAVAGAALLPVTLAAAPSSSTPSEAAAAAPRAAGHDGHHAREAGRKGHRIQARGAGTWAMPDIASTLRRSRVSWVYNWSAQPTFPVPAGVRFVPMIWGAKAVTRQNLAAVTKYGPDLLTFNEPEFGSQANLKVGEALDLWPQLEATGMRLSSPAVTVDAVYPHSWLDNFMRRARNRGLRVDFIALHWYAGTLRPGTVENLKRFVTEVHRLYHRPIWLTEFSIVAHEKGRLVYPRQRVEARFATKATRMLDRLPFVEKYAWFALPAPDHGRSSGLFHFDGTPTPAGRAYRRGA